MGQYAWVFDVVWLLLILGTTYVVSSEGLWGAALMFVNLMFAGLVAFCIYEPCAKAIANGIPFMAAFADFTCLVVLFCVAFFLIRLATDNLGYTMVRFPGWLYHLGRFLFGAATAWYAWGMFLCMLETAPIHKQFLGYQWQNHAVWGAGIDRFWLGFVQSATRNTFEWNPPKVFDARNDFIIRYHGFREFGDPDPDMPAAVKRGGGGAAPPGGGPAPGGGAGAPLNPAEKVGVDVKGGF